MLGIECGDNVSHHNQGDSESLEQIGLLYALALCHI